MPTNLIIVNNPADWALDTPGVEVADARAYLTDPKYARLRTARVFNLCRSYRYQSIGYYVSLLAAARGHKPLPGVTTIQDLKTTSLIRIAGWELEDEIQKSLKTIQSDTFIISMYFGKNVAKRYDRLSAKLFRIFPAPLLRAEFARDAEGVWDIKSLNPIPASEIPENHHEYVVDFAREFFSKKRVPASGEFVQSRYSMAILRNPEEEEPPSDDKAIARFTRAAEKMDFSVEEIGREDYARLAEFDALFIRETTNVNHHTYRFARRAQAEGLVVIDDPDSILRCSNKVFLAELLERAKIPTPKTLIVHRDNIEEVAAKVGLPAILKQPDSSFSRGVIKVDTQEQLIDMVKKLLEKSELVIAQEFLPTPFDWRVGILDRQPLYVCKYHMSRSHWQIVKRDQEGDHWGDVDSVPLWQAPPHVVQMALKASNLIGDSLYGVDLKEVNGNVYVIEINDNPDIATGMEDDELKEQFYQRMVEVFLKRVEQKKERRSAK